YFSSRSADPPLGPALPPPPPTARRFFVGRLSAAPHQKENPVQLTGAQALVRSLEHQGVDVVFGLPGGAILPAYDPLLTSSMRHILVRHEQGACRAAEGYASSTGRGGA